MNHFDDDLEREAAALWRKENPTKSVFACDADEKERYRQRIRDAASESSFKETK